MSSEFSGIGEEFFDFGDTDSLIDKDLAEIDIDEVIKRAELLRDFPKCNISMDNQQEDVLSRACRESGMEKDFNSTREWDMETDGNPIPPDGINRVPESPPISNVNEKGLSDDCIPAEVSVQQLSGAKFTARKSLPSHTKAGGFSYESGGVQVSNINGFVSAKELRLRQQQEQQARWKQTRSNEETNCSKQPSVTITPISSSGDEQRSSDTSASNPKQTNQQQQQQDGMEQNEVQVIYVGEHEEKVVKAEVEAAKANPSIASQITLSIVEMNDRLSTGPSFGVKKNGETGFIQHAFPSASAESLRGSRFVSPNTSEEGEMVSVREVAVADCQDKRSVPAGMVSFVLIMKQENGWCAPPIEKWEEITNAMEICVLQNWPELHFVLRHARKWRGCGTFCLDATHLDLLEKWRDLVPILNPLFNTFPRDALQLADEVSVMMMDDLRNFKVEFLPWSMFIRNTALQGSVRVTCSKEYGQYDYTAISQQSKAGWRLCFLEGDVAFMKSLSQFPIDHKFEVGCGLVKIRGGIRRPSVNRLLEYSRSSRKWVRDPNIPLLRSLTPVSIRPFPSSVGVQRAASVGSITETTLRSEPKVASSKIKNRSERLKKKKVPYQLRTRSI